MWRWIKGLWEDEDVFARLLKAIGVAGGIYLSTPMGRGEIERAIPALLAFVAQAIPSTKPRE